MRRDRLKWNRKYRREAFADQSAAIVRTYAHLAPVGRALDVACGNGRNACYLAGRGFAVDAVDIALEGLQRFACRPTGIQRICADLDDFVIPPGRYSLIVNTRFLDRRLFPALQAGLCPGGVLIFESYRTAPAGAAGGPHRPEHLLKPDELRRAFSRLRMVVYREQPSLHADAPAMKASLVAVRPAD
jgi:SAM-dependent methyltransferase